jgi:hypothetical protein
MGKTAYLTTGWRLVYKEMGTYRVQFFDYGGIYVNEYYSDAANLATAADISVTAGSTVSNIDAQLANAGSISGTVTDSSGNVLENITVSACLWNGSSCSNWYQDVYFDEFGSYTIFSLGTGTYRVRFEDVSGTYITEYYNNASTLDSATNISVTAGSTVHNINAQLVATAGSSGGGGGGDDTPPTPVVTPGTGSTNTTATVGGKPVTVVTSGTTVVTATAPGQNLLATTNPDSNTPAIVVTANQTGAQATGTAENGQTTVELKGDTTVTVQPGSNTDNLILVIPPSTGSTPTHVTLNVGGQTLVIEAPVAGQNTTVSFTLDAVIINGVATPLPSPKDGELKVSANSGCAPMMAVNNTPVSAGADNTQANAVRQNGIVSVGVTQGEGLVGTCSSSRNATGAGTKVMVGETAELTSEGELIRIRLGSLERNQAQTGDPMKLPMLSLLQGITVEGPAPILSGKSVRVAEEPAQVLKKALERHGFTQEGDSSAWGGLKLALGEAVYSIQPVGVVEIKPGNTAPKMEAPGNGDFRLTEGQMAFTLAPAFHEPTQLGLFVRSLGGRLAIQEDASAWITLGGSLFALQAGYEVLGNRTPGLETDATSGYLIWTDSSGKGQWVFPASADFKAFESAVKALDKSWTLRGNGDGSLTLNTGTATFTLLPDYALVNVPEDKATEAYWLGEDGRVFVRYPKLNKAQGFVVR